MKFSHLAAATCAAVLMGGAASAQQPAAPAPDAAARAAPATASDVTVSLSNVREPDGTKAKSATFANDTVSLTATTVSNSPVADTPENRAKYGEPMSNAGKRTAPKGN